MFVPERPKIVPGGGFRMGMKTSSRKRAQWKTAYSTEDKIDLEYARLNNFKFIGMKVLYQTGDMDEPEPATVVEVIGDWYYRVLTDEGYEYELDGTAITTVLGSRRAQ
jgi:hypothetical protein